jgi:hypothetical protein
MLSVLETLVDTLLVLGKSIWGWLGVVIGLAASWLVWSYAGNSTPRGPLAAATFALVFMLFCWQELRKK